MIFEPDDPSFRRSPRDLFAGFASGVACGVSIAIVAIAIFFFAVETAKYIGAITRHFAPVERLGNTDDR